jgi:hypothetical protein
LAKQINQIRRISETSLAIHCFHNFIWKRFKSKHPSFKENNLGQHSRNKIS